MCLRPCVQGDTTQCQMASGCWCPRVGEKKCGSSGARDNPRCLSDAHSPPAARGEASLAASAAPTPALQGQLPRLPTPPAEETLLCTVSCFFLLLEIAPWGYVYLLCRYLCLIRRRLRSCNADKCSGGGEGVLMRLCSAQPRQLLAVSHLFYVLWLILLPIIPSPLLIPSPRGRDRLGVSSELVTRAGWSGSTD